MQSGIKRYRVQHPLLQKYIKFFWEFKVGLIHLNHKIIPQRNINLRINLSDTPHYFCTENKNMILDKVYFGGLQSRFLDASLKVVGDVDIIGISFMPYGFYPFINIPLAEFSNRLFSFDEVGLNISQKIIERLKTTQDIIVRLKILEQELLNILCPNDHIFNKFQQIFSSLAQKSHIQLGDFCKQNNISIRQLERYFLKYIGLPPNTYGTLSRFHYSLNQLLNTECLKLSNLAYDNEYFDQMHFIKDFKRYAGITPNKFINQNNSILQLSKFV